MASKVEEDDLDRNPFSTEEPPTESYHGVENAPAIPAQATAGAAEVEDAADESGYEEDEEDEKEKQNRAAAAMDKQVLRNYLTQLLTEARSARDTGPESRNLQWRRNWEAYWTRYDHSGKEPWQAAEDLPDVANYVERFVAALRRALTSAGSEWFTFIDPLDEDGTLEAIVKKIVEMGLSTCGKNSTGQPTGFPTVFAMAMKDGALMMPALAVLWRDGRLAVDVVDARELYYDPTGRGLYRFREREIDKWELYSLVDLEDENGDPLYDKDAIDRCANTGGAADMQREDKTRSTGVEQHSTVDRYRKVFAIQEFYGHILDDDGNCIAKDQLVVMANETEIIRGPEPNPFWHGRDWIVASPIIGVPHSVYGKSYAEGFIQLVQTFIDMTNLILDGIQVTSIPTYNGWPGQMEDPTQLSQGITPGKIFVASEDAQVGEPFLMRVDTGAMNPQAFQIWEALRGLIREASSQNELRLGQLTNRSGVTATEVDAASAGTEALLQHIAEDVEEQLLSPTLNLVWPTMLQHMDPANDKRLRLELGEDIARMIEQRRTEFRDRTIQLRAEGMSGLMKKSRERRALLEMMQIVGQSEVLGQTFARSYSFENLFDQLLRTSGIDPRTLAMSPEQKSKQMAAAESARRSIPQSPAEDPVQNAMLEMAKARMAQNGGGGGAQ